MLLLVATLATALFAGAAVYVSLVEHPARVSCGLDVALREFGPSNKRGAVMQASLALIGCVAGLAVGWQLGDGYVALASVLLGLLVPFTLIVILPTNKRLLAPTLDSRSSTARGPDGRIAREPRRLALEVPGTQRRLVAGRQRVQDVDCIANIQTLSGPAWFGRMCIELETLCVV
jgi:Domain of unknown function (DUF1772)